MSGTEENGSGEHVNMSNNPRVMGAIQYPTEEERNVTIHPNQPRQPHNLQDLHRFSVEASTAGQHATNQNIPFIPGPMDEERRRFLENTMTSLTMDVITLLMDAIDVLKNAGTLELEDDPIACEEAFEQIAFYVDNIDTANDFHKIGGFCIFRPCLNSCHSCLRWRAADILAELTQNNPYCQDRVLEADLLPDLLSLVDTDPNDNVRVKSLYALSCLIRENDNSLNEFGHKDGYSVLLRAMQSQVEKLQIKSAFLLTFICNHKECIKDELYKMGYVEQLIGLVSEGQPPGLEHLLSALLALVTNHPPSVEVCRQPQLQLRAVLRNLLRQNEGQDDRQEENEYTSMLMRLIFSGESDEER